ncbi:MAG: hypothetical protein V2J16_08280 [Thermoleophilia bacterium]|nr:hypothetical protein [Thermoleophilia bacterium]
MRLRHLRFVIPILVIALAAVTAPAALAATGYETPKPAVITVDGDKFYNYDFYSPNYLPPSDPKTAQVDWPVTVIFTGNATVPKVKAIVGSFLPSVGMPIYARLKDSPYRWQWDVDLGCKERAFKIEDGKLVPRPLCLHIRLYARYGYASRNAEWGRYVLCTTHFDYNEFGQVPGTTVKWSGMSEMAEDQLSNALASTYVVAEDAFPCDNLICDPLPLPLGTPPVGDGHVFQSDGKATLIYIP